jgi:uncharacterized protein (DUF2147 family)
MKRFFIVCALAAVGMWASSEAMAWEPWEAAVLGNWLTQPKDGIIEIARQPDGTVQGRIVGGAYPGRKDANNPDPALRDRVLRGQVIMKGLKPSGVNHWSGGTIYDPDKGSTYRCYLDLQPDGTLKLRGFIGFALLGRTQTWTRYSGTSMDLPSPPK